MERIIERLRTLVPDLDGTTIADSIWLAAVCAALEAKTALEPSTPSPSALREAHAPSDELAAPTQSGPNSDGRPLFDSPGTAGPTVPGRPVTVHRAGGLPRQLALARSLRPFQRRWPAGHRRRLDIDATVRGYARTGQLIPQFSPAPERWFEAVVVIDEALGMAVWDEIVTEFGDILQQLGAFRSVHKWTLTADSRVRDRSGRLGDPAKLRSPDGRRLILVISDCSAESWYGQDVWNTLRNWGESTPTVLVNPLSPRIWRHTAMSQPALVATAQSRGGSNSRLSFRLPAGLSDSRDRPHALPVVTLTPHSLDRWARALMRTDRAGCEVLLLGAPHDGALSMEREPEPASDVLVERFLRIASPAAARLAVLCSPYSEISLPLVNLVRQQLVPDATVGDIAELAIGGLLTASRDAAGRPLLRFVDGVQTALQHKLIEDDAWRAHDVLSRYVATHAGHQSGFSVLVPDPSGRTGIPAGLQPFASASRELLRLLGVETPIPDQPVVGRSALDTDIILQVEASAPDRGAIKTLSKALTGVGAASVHHAADPETSLRAGRRPPQTY